jgi:hypothetical protein
MKKLVVLFLIFILLCTAVQATGVVTGTDAETEMTEAPPTDTGGTDDLTETFLNINIWMFVIALALFLICTVIAIIYKKKKSET